MAWTYHDPVFAHEADPAAAWRGHRRFGYDLVRNLRPQRLVELGACLGTSFFAFCQAVKDGGLATELCAVDTWEGDEHTGWYGPGYLEQFNAIWRSRFPDLAVRQIKRSFDEARKEVPAGSVDILHLDGCHTYEAARHDYETWDDSVRKGGVILFHDIAVRDRGFGVYRLWEELRASFPTAEFAHSFGLGVLFKSDPPPDLARLQQEWPRRYDVALTSS
jgi:methyltransferase family protein